MNVSLDALREEMRRLIARFGKSAAQDALVSAVANRIATPEQATQLSAEFWPGE